MYVLCMRIVHTVCNVLYTTYMCIECYTLNVLYSPWCYTYTLHTINGKLGTLYYTPWAL